MKKIIFSILLVFLITDSFSQCVNADSLYTDNITYLNALANWRSAPAADHYMIHYRELNTTTWSNLQNITGNDTTRNIENIIFFIDYFFQKYEKYE